MLMFLIPLVLCEVVSMESLAVLATPLKQFARFGPLLRGCYTISAVPRFLNFYTIPALITSSIMFVMTLHKCGFAIYNQMTSEMPVIRLFARDGIVWFIAVLLITCTDIIIWTAGRPTLAEVNIV
ncbi:hypothetical protein B0H13DRAFT_697137 [Mycena leptocephala]|nr:hypothetical protein B0H13DRAFT_697137 [Mycena leptocephala]